MVQNSVDILFHIPSNSICFYLYTEGILSAVIFNIIYYLFFINQKVQSELEGLKKDLNSITEKTEEILASPQQSSSAPMLRSELDITLKKMDHVYGLSSVYLDK